ncbi:Imidazoleglycerol-phosphate dehydratase [Rhodococcus sp. AW25M09]|nr:Imidazoleglycerol-phosphate dehydratase [Rhodococcus sp. AW25M09]
MQRIDVGAVGDCDLDGHDGHPGRAVGGAQAGLDRAGPQRHGQRHLHSGDEVELREAIDGDDQRPHQVCECTRSMPKMLFYSGIERHAARREERGIVAQAVEERRDHRIGSQEVAAEPSFR